MNPESTPIASFIPKLTRPSDVAALLQTRGIRPNRVMGQNFLIDANILRIIVEAAEIGPTDVVLEVGPGLGVLTAPLLEAAAGVVAIEKDAGLHAYLTDCFRDQPKFTLIHADAMDVSLPDLLQRGITRFVSNLPYAIGSRILIDLFEQPAAPSLYVVTVQKEVGDRLAAPPGSDDYGLLGILAQLDHDVKLVKTVSPSCFFPPPQIKSAIVSIRRRTTPRGDLRDRAAFKSLVKLAFSRRRKQLATILVGSADHPHEVLNEAGIDPKERPENVDIAAWIRLSNALTARRGSAGRVG